MSAPYPPGQPPWPENQPHQPPPIEFRRAGQTPPGGGSALAWTLRIAGLVAIAVISGVVWWYIQHSGSSDTPTGYGGSQGQHSPGEYVFTPKLAQPRVDDACSEHAYGEIKQFLTDTPCDRLIRDVYTTRIHGRLIYAGVSVVRMSNAENALKLRQLTDADNTGNVSDLVREGEVKVEGRKSLSAGGGYKSTQHEREVVIVEADYLPTKSAGGTEAELDRVCTDALRLGKDMVADTG